MTKKVITLISVVFMSLFATVIYAAYSGDVESQGKAISNSSREYHLHVFREFNSFIHGLHVCDKSFYVVENPVSTHAPATRIQILGKRNGRCVVTLENHYYPNKNQVHAHRRDVKTCRFSPRTIHLILKQVSKLRGSKAVYEPDALLLAAIRTECQ